MRNGSESPKGSLAARADTSRAVNLGGRRDQGAMDGNGLWVKFDVALLLRKVLVRTQSTATLVQLHYFFITAHGSTYKYGVQGWDSLCFGEVVSVILVVAVRTG